MPGLSLDQINRAALWQASSGGPRHAPWHVNRTLFWPLGNGTQEQAKTSKGNHRLWKSREAAQEHADLLNATDPAPMVAVVPRSLF